MSSFRDGRTGTKRPYDRVEISPNNQATCKLCKNTIKKGHLRIVVHYIKRSPDYYHKTCVSSRGTSSSIFNKNKTLNFKSQSASKHTILSIEEQIETELCYCHMQRRKRKLETIKDHL